MQLISLDLDKFQAQYKLLNIKQSKFFALVESRCKICVKTFQSYLKNHGEQKVHEDHFEALFMVLKVQLDQIPGSPGLTRDDLQFSPPRTESAPDDRDQKPTKPQHQTATKPVSSNAALSSTSPRIEECGTGEIFQNFPQRGDDENPYQTNVVSYLWADPYEDDAWIKAWVMNAEQPPSAASPGKIGHKSFLHVEYSNGAGRGWPSNLAITGLHGLPLKRTHDYCWLAIDVRALPVAGEYGDGKDADKIQVAIRIHDKNRISWKHYVGGRYIQFLVPRGGGWRTLYAELGDGKKWVSSPRATDKSLSPDFSVIQDLVLEFGNKHVERPAGGSGTIEIANIRLTKTKSKGE